MQILEPFRGSQDRRSKDDLRARRMAQVHQRPRSQVPQEDDLAHNVFLQEGVR